MFGVVVERLRTQVFRRVPCTVRRVVGETIVPPAHLHVFGLGRWRRRWWFAVRVNEKLRIKLSKLGHPRLRKAHLWRRCAFNIINDTTVGIILIVEFDVVKHVFDFRNLFVDGAGLLPLKSDFKIKLLLNNRTQPVLKREVALRGRCHNRSRVHILFCGCGCFLRCKRGDREKEQGKFKSSRDDFSGRFWNDKKFHFYYGYTGHTGTAAATVRDPPLFVHRYLQQQVV